MPASGVDGPALSVAGAARGLGVAPATLRSWERRYGIAPSLYTKGGHRRYGPADLARLQVMHRLVRNGVPPAEAARVAMRSSLDGEFDEEGPYAALLAAAAADRRSAADERSAADRASGRADRSALDGRSAPDGGSAADDPSIPDGLRAPGSSGESRRAGSARGESARGQSARAESRRSESTPVDSTREPAVPAGSPGGGRVLPLPRRSQPTRGLARAALALDAPSCARVVHATLAAHGAVATWEELVRPVLAGIGERWERTGHGVEAEHSLSAIAHAALSSHAAELSRPSNDRPVLMASVAGELHDLPLVALGAALADVGIRSHLVGARTPDDALGRALVRLGAPVVVLWSQIGPAWLPQLPPMRPEPTVLVGGPGWAEVPPGVRHLDGLTSAVGAVRAALGL